MASTVRITSTLTGVHEGTTHTLTGTRDVPVNGVSAETFDVTTAYANVNYDANLLYHRVLVSNEGSDEVKIRIERGAGTTWEYHNLPAGRCMEILNGSATVHDSNIGQVSIKALNTSSRVTVLQAWI